MRKHKGIAMCLVAVGCGFLPARAALGLTWQPVRNNIFYCECTYTEITSNPPQVIHITRMERDEGNYSFIASSLAYGVVSGSREKMSDQADRYDGAVHYWGGLNGPGWGVRSVQVAINGMAWDTNTGIRTGGVITNTSYDRRFDELTDYGVFLWKTDRTPYISKMLTHQSTQQFVVFAAAPATSPYMYLQGLNCDRGSDQFILYNDQYGTTPSGGTGVVEILVETDTPAMLAFSNGLVSGKVVQIVTDQGGMTVPFSHVVLSASGTAATDLLGQNLQVGDDIQIAQRVTEVGTNYDFEGTYAGISGNEVLVEGSKVVSGLPTSPRDSRTAVAFDRNYVYFLVCDKNVLPPVQEGMTLAELAQFLVDKKHGLPVSEAVNLDGGGSSTMWIAGRGLVNRPDDLGIERPVPAGLMMCEQGTSYRIPSYEPGETVRNLANAHLYRGPGINYTTIAVLSPYTQLTVLDHELNGIKVKGYYMVPVSYAGQRGWVRECDVEVMELGDTTIVDNGDSDFSVTMGSWTTYTGDGFGDDYVKGCCVNPYQVTHEVKYQPTLTAGTYKVYFRQPMDETTNTYIGCKIHSYDPDTQQYVDETYVGYGGVPKWTKFGFDNDGIFYFQSGNAGYTSLNNKTSIISSGGPNFTADAFRFVRIGDLP